MPSPTPRDDTSPDGGAAASDATALLAHDHQEVRSLFQQYERSAQGGPGASNRRALVERICTMLETHTRIEEEIFYPAARDAGVDESLLDEAESEHASAKTLIGRLRSAGADDADTDATVTELAGAIEHHVQEEESELFPQCRHAGMDLEETGRRLAERKRALTAQGARQ